MDMQKIMLEALAYSNEDISREIGRKLANLVSYEFPVQQNTATSPSIRDRLESGQPITFEWAANNCNGDATSLFVLGKSLVPYSTKDRMFFGKEGPKPQFPFMSEMKEGPKIFDYFGAMIARDLWEKSANTVSTKFDKEGNAVTHAMDSVNELDAAFVPYYKNLENELKKGYKFIMDGTRVADDSKKNKETHQAALYGAYLKYIFDVFKDAEKQISESDATKATIRMGNGVLATAKNLNKEYDTLKKMTSTLDDLKNLDVDAMDASKREEVSETIDLVNEKIADIRERINKLEKTAGNDAYAISHNVMQSIPTDDTGSLTNYGSVYNRDEVLELKVVDPSTINNSKVAQYRVYPRYVIDVLRLEKKVDGDNRKDDIAPFVNLLKGTKYSGFADVLKTLGSFEGKNNRILPITSDELIGMLSDDDFIRKCINANLGGIFTKDGKSWVSVVGSTVDNKLNRVLNGKPQETNADLRMNRVVPVVEGKSLKNANTDRENTGDGIVAQGHDDMIIADAVAVKEANGKPTKLKYTTRDTGNQHWLTLTPDVVEKIKSSRFKKGFNNVIARKVKTSGSGHEYFLSIPFGIAFVAMQDEEGNIVRNDNMGTLSTNMSIKSYAPKYPSVNRLMNSPVGKYCNAVANLGKVGRIRFDNTEANDAYTKVLAALQYMKRTGQEFSPTQRNKYNAIQDIKTVLTYYVKAKLNNPTDSIVSEKVDEVIAPLSAIGLTMYAERYNASKGTFDFKPVLNIYPTLMRHLGEMYNLDITNKEDGYTSTSVVRILEAVAPNVLHLDDWNYGNVMRADKVLNASDVDAVAEDNEEGFDDERDADTDHAADDGYGVEDGDDGDTDYDHQGEYDIPVSDSGKDIENTLDDVVEDVQRELFEQYGNTPRTARDASYMKMGLVLKFNELTEDNKLNLPGIVHAVESIDEYSDYKDFMRQYRTRVQELIDNQRDDSITMGVLPESGMSTYWKANVVKNVLMLRMPESADDEDLELIPEIGGLMAKFAFVKSDDNGDMGVKFDDRDSLVSVFEDTFENEYKALIDRFADLTQKNESIDTTHMDAESKDNLRRELVIASRDVELYRKIENKIDSDAQYVSIVADLIVRNSDEINRNIMGTARNVDATNSNFVPFRADTATRANSAGGAIIDFCMFNFGEDKGRTIITKLTNAFEDATVGAMLDALVSSVPSECIPMDIKEETGVDALKQQMQMKLKGYFKSKNRKMVDPALTQQIKSIYMYGDAVSMFAVDKASGKTSPYTYGSNHTPIDLDKVKQFYDELMNLTDVYNNGQKHIQVTSNNEEMDKHVLYNPYFVTLKTKFGNVYTNYKENNLFDLTAKKVMDRVVRDVLSNPMNVLINNNIKLVTAYYYHCAGIDKNLNAQYQPNQSMGKGFDKKNALQGINSTYDSKLAVLRLAERLTQSEDFVLDILPAAQRAVGNVDNASVDYDSYLDSIDGDGSHVNDLLTQVLDEKDTVDKEQSITADEKVTPREKKRKSIVSDSALFCNYGTDENSNAAYKEKVSKLRTSELIVLLYQTAHDIWKKIPMSSIDTISDAVNANSKVLRGKTINKVNEIIPDDLATRFTNLDAELQLADPKKHKEIFRYTNSNNNPAASASDIMHGRKKPQNLTGEIIDMIISDEPLDEATLEDKLNESKVTGNSDTDSDISWNGKCDVNAIDSSGAHIASNIILHVGDIILFKGDYVNTSASVTSVLDKKTKQYVITKVVGLHSGAKDVPFVRFQRRNAFQGGDITVKLTDILDKLMKWCDGNTPSNVPDDIMFKALCLKNIVAGSGCANIIKSIVSYYVWKLSGYSAEYTPAMNLGGDTVHGEYFTLLRNLIAADLKKYYTTDKVIYEAILKVATKCGIMSSIHDEFSLTSNAEKIRSAKETSDMLITTASDTNVRITLVKLVNSIGEQTGFVDPAEVKDALEKEKLSSLVDEYDDILNKIIEDYNWKIAKPIIESYKSSCVASGSVPDLDGAIDYVRDNYVEKKVSDENGNRIDRGDNAKFAKYLAEHCTADIGWLLTN